MKQFTRAQLQGRKEKAVRFTREVLGDPARADEIEGESLEDYAERRKVKLLNPYRKGKAIMPRGKTKAELEDQIADLQDENEELEDHERTRAPLPRYVRRRIANGRRSPGACFGAPGTRQREGDGEALLALGARPPAAIRGRREAHMGP